ncbi:hypothetical protein HP398_05035 [Brevibacillus sp. HB1.4B]|uniref:hypothetical protein n=1 Tax=unclassified Brevibacillus TaxID=2684853 RepID=UPI0006F9C5CE|nr:MULTISPECIES: hypothetical protein [unclassified Brevibacillus]NRS15797.1 hypothetical protein [Brevibacillus sp. HB1.4B]RAT94515.1 hypothetical protein ASG16_030545 [Brevibacillus sp. Leaf182]
MPAFLNWLLFIVLLIGSSIQLFLDLLMGADIPVVLDEGEFIRFIQYSGVLFSLFIVFLSLQRKISILIINTFVQIIIAGWWSTSLESSLGMETRVDELIYSSLAGLGSSMLIITYSLVLLVKLLKETGKIKL